MKNPDLTQVLSETFETIRAGIDTWHKTLSDLREAHARDGELDEVEIATAALHAAARAYAGQSTAVNAWVLESAAQHFTAACEERLRLARAPRGHA